ncbi:autophagy-related protein 23-like [Pyrus ussuriensis x Pyrus communis]|uniref:Autophagy-related protein 23-like n=1 Tax=Pyrus ussuriensis x Pyrus communis TaxID=2448454 RepID=A0A5N5IJG5_9ROSA|nr:autophagy-related protein 23-like [Pyrus ussuriensis x Pyrus communis]
MCSLVSNTNHNKMAFRATAKRKGSSLRVVSLVLNNRKLSISDNGASEPARILLERLFAQTQKLEERMSRNSRHPQDVQLGLNLEILESDLHAALAALKNEEDLQDAERKVFFEHSRSSLSLKEEELEQMRNELLNKREEAAKSKAELESKAHLLNEANEEASRHLRETNETLEDFRRTKKLLADVRLELVSSQKSLASSRKKMEEQKNVMSCLKTLRDAQIQVQSERAKLKVELSMEKELMEELQEVLKKERYSLDQAINGISSLQNKLTRKTIGNVEAKLEIQHLKSEWDSINVILDEKDSGLLNARNKLEEVNKEIAELKMLLDSKEDQLIQATALLKEKDECVKMMQNELNNTKLKYSEVETVVERIVELTNKLVIPIKDEDYNESGLQIKQLQTELDSARDSLRVKEMEVLAFQRALTLKDEELKMVLRRIETKEQEVKQWKEEAEAANDLRKLYALVQEILGEKSIGDWAIEKLQLEAAQIEAEAATNVLHKLAETNGELLHKGSMRIEADGSIFNNECLTAVTAEVAQISALTDKLVKEAGVVISVGPIAGQ